MHFARFKSVASGNEDSLATVTEEGLILRDSSEEWREGLAHLPIADYGLWKDKAAAQGAKE